MADESKLATGEVATLHPWDVVPDVQNECPDCMTGARLHDDGTATVTWANGATTWLGAGEAPGDPVQLRHYYAGGIACGRFQTADALRNALRSLAVGAREN